MKPSVNNLNSDQPKKLSKREDKKSVNPAWNHGLYFQIGLVVSLLIVFFVMEMSIGYKTARVDTNKGFILEELPMTVFTLHKEPTMVVQKKNIERQADKSKSITDVITEVPDDSQLTEAKTTSTDTPIIDQHVDQNPSIPIVVNDGPKNMITVEFVPVFPGCESLSTNDERKACMSSKIAEFVQKRFKTDKFDKLVNSGEQKIYVQFKIDATGSIVDVKARGPHNSLEKEASRVISQLPQMQPGKQGSTSVAVLYSLPIVFQIN